MQTVSDLSVIHSLLLGCFRRFVLAFVHGLFLQRECPNSHNHSYPRTVVGAMIADLIRFEPEIVICHGIGAKKTMTATDVTGFDAIFSTGFFATFSRF